MDKKSTWHLVRCKPRESFKAEKNLVNQNFYCFHPTFPIKKKIKNKVCCVVEPLFPSYIFVMLFENQSFSTIRSTRGVNGIVSFNQKPAIVSHELIDAIKYRCNILNSIEPAPLFKVDQKVKITNGCFKDIEAIITATKGEDRVMLLLNLLGRPQIIEISASYLVSV